MQLVFLPDICFFKTNINSKALKSFKNFLTKLHRLFPDSNFVSNLECVLLKKKNKSSKNNLTKFDAEHTLANFLKHNKINNVCLANNHSFDFGIKGFNQTTKYLNKAKINYFGAGKNINSAKKPLIIKSSKRNLAIFGLSYKPEASTKKSGVFSLKKKSSIEIIKKFKKKNKKFFIIAYCHSGLELFEYPLKRDEIIYKKLIDSGCDIVIGSHPHRTQGIERYKKKFIFYSIGDLFFNNINKIDWIKYLTPPAHAFFYKKNLKQTILFRSLILKIDCIKNKVNVYEVKRDKNFSYNINKISNLKLDKNIIKFKKSLSNNKILKIRNNIEKKIFYNANIS